MSRNNNSHNSCGFTLSLAVFWVLYIYHIIYRHNSPETVAIISPILQLGKLRHKEVKVSQVRKYDTSLGSQALLNVFFTISLHCLPKRTWFYPFEASRAIQIFYLWHFQLFWMYLKVAKTVGILLHVLHFISDEERNWAELFFGN